MKIGLVAPPWLPVPPQGYGGTEAVIDRLARGFVAEGHDVLLWTTGDSTCDVSRGHVLERCERARMGAAVVEVRHLIHGYNALAEWGAEVVHDHTVMGPLYGQRFPQFTLVTTNHGPFNDELSDLYRTVAGRVAIVGISDDQAQRADGLKVDAVIHHGIDVEDIPVGDGGGDERGEFFFFLGRMAAEKGAHRAIAAAREAGVRLLIAAKMQDRAEKHFFSKHIEPMLDDDIVYLGEVSCEEKLDLLGRARALVNPIRWAEPFGLVMIEALACGTPVIAFPEGSAPEIVQHGTTGFLAEDEHELAAYMRRIDELDRDSCRLSAEVSFSTERMVQQHVALYERLLARRDEPTV
jgi:glycosyltransferase involved in cell wall biosynthesis